jgi:UDP-2-acetamido-2-deoxy-ribo-hexuluronate aminotransferase
MSTPIAFIDLKAQRARLGARLDAAIAEVVDSCAFIMGPPVRELEGRLAAFAGAAHCLSCANGTEALVLPLMAWDIRPGDAVFCPSFTFAATAEVVPWLGATPVFVDILPDTYNMDPAALDRAIAATIAEGKLKPKVVIAVDLFGQPADYPAIAAVTRKYGLKLIADSAQGFGCTLGGHHPMHWADVTTTSFFPAKPLGCYGDGGAVLTNDSELNIIMESMRVHGQATPADLAREGFTHEAKYLNVRIGMNSRLDTIQAAVLLEKLAIFDDEIAARNRIAARYSEALGGCVHTPRVIDAGVSVWAQYTVETDARDAMLAHLKTHGVPTAVYYPIPIHRQRPYARFPTPGGLPITDAASSRVFSLPMHPYLDEATQDRVIAAVRSFTGAGQ